MSREIKFRAYVKKPKRMVEVRILEMGEKIYALHQWFKKEEYELMQYTGLKDKNGVEIYEGDIVKATNYPAIEVIYDKESCSFKMKVQYIGWEDLLILSSNKTPHLEVIGNVWEHKHLLGKQNDS